MNLIEKFASESDTKKKINSATNSIVKKKIPIKQTKVFASPIEKHATFHGKDLEHFTNTKGESCFIIPMKRGLLFEISVHGVESCPYLAQLQPTSLRSSSSRGVNKISVCERISGLVKRLSNENWIVDHFDITNDLRNAIEDPNVIEAPERYFILVQLLKKTIITHNRYNYQSEGSELDAESQFVHLGDCREDLGLPFKSLYMSSSLLSTKYLDMSPVDLELIDKNLILCFTHTFLSPSTISNMKVVIKTFNIHLHSEERGKTFFLFNDEGLKELSIHTPSTVSSSSNNNNTEITEDDEETENGL